MARLSRHELSRRAACFRANNDLSATEAINLKSLLLKLNILTVFRPLSDDFAGMCIKSGDHKFILVNSNNNLGRQNFTIAHELFHLYQEEKIEPHKCNPGYPKNDSEYNADGFAAELLMPRDGLLKMMPPGKVTIRTILKLEQYYGVSRQSLLYRLRNTNLITEREREEMDEYPRAATAREYRHDTSLYKSGNEGLVIGDFGEKAKTLFDEGKISRGHYYELINLLTGNDGTEED